jgi:hypothetical protein
MDPLTMLRRSVQEKLYPLASRFIAKSWIAEGALKDGAGPARILFIHNCLFNRHLEQRTFVEPATTGQQRILIPTIAGRIRQAAGKVDLVCAVLPRWCAKSFAEFPHYVGREEVRQIIPTRCAWDTVRLGFSKKKRQTANDFPAKFGLDYRISHSMEDFDLFYDRMYVPHIRRRYGLLADIDDREDMRRVFGSGLLLFVLSDGKPVAGALSVVSNNQLMFRRTGVLDGDESHVRGGAQTALYYFQLRHAVDQGFDALDTMKSAPFLNDGVFLHKADWGARSVRDEEAERAVFLVPLAGNELLARFFSINPMIIDHDGGLAALVGEPADEPAGAGAHQRSPKRFHTTGLQQIITCTKQGVKAEPVAERAPG